MERIRAWSRFHSISSDAVFNGSGGVLLHCSPTASAAAVAGAPLCSSVFLMEQRERSRVYIGNLPYEVDAEELTNILSEFGRVRDVDIKYSRQPTGYAFAFAEYADSDAAKEAVEKGQNIKLSQGSVVSIEFSGNTRRPVTARTPPTSSSSSREVDNMHIRSPRRVIVHNLPPSTSWQDLKDHMRRVGPVMYAAVDDSQGTGFVEYRDKNYVLEAIKTLNNTVLRTHTEREATIKVQPYDYRS